MGADCHIPEGGLGGLPPVGISISVSFRMWEAKKREGIVGHVSSSAN